MNELYHYGVLGMKWGIRRARRKGVEYNYRSHGQKKYAKKLAKAEKKGNQYAADDYREKLNAYKTRDKARVEYAKRTSVGADIARNIVLGAWGNGSYNRARAAGASVGKAALAGLGTNIAIAMPPIGLPIAVAISKGHENDVGRARSGR